ncbi:hypothetical protein CRYUN_Cryun23aG0126900 [Craigia yunnanensis]
MMRRKIKSRKERKMLEKGSVEVVEASVELPSVSLRLQLDKQELMNNILKAKAATGKLAWLESSGSQNSKSVDFERENREIKVMAKKARETGDREQSMIGKDEKEVQAVNKEFSDEMQPIKEDGQDGVIFLSNLSTADSVQGTVGYRTLESTSPYEPKGDGVKFLNGVASLDSRVRKLGSSFPQNPTKEELKQEPVRKAEQESAPDLMLPNDNRSGRSTKQIINVNKKMFPHAISSGESESTTSENACQSVIWEDKESILNEENDKDRGGSSTTSIFFSRKHWYE